MLSIDLNRMVQQIVTHELYGKGRDDEAMYFHFDVSMSAYDNSGKNFSSRHGLHLLYHCRKNGTYITVFSAVTERAFDKPSEWNYEGSHDSCWRDTKAYSEVYFRMADEVNAKRKLAGLKDIAPAHMSELNGFAAFSKGLFTWIPVKIESDLTDENRYKKLVTLL